MEWSPKDFQNLYFNVYDMPDNAQMKKHFPVLKLYKEFDQKVKNVSFNKLFSYICFAFDRNSPLVIGINQIFERRVEAALLAKFEVKDGRFAPEVDEFLRSLNPAVNAMIIRFCILLSEDDYTTLITYQDSLYKQQSAMLGESDEGVIARLVANIKNIRAEITAIKQEFLSNNVDLFLTKSLIQHAESEKINHSPEYYAHIMKGWDGISKYYKNANK